MKSSSVWFCDYPGEVEATNNGSERKLRPCVIQRKVTNGYRAMWAAQAEVDVRTTVDTARTQGHKPLPDNPRHPGLKPQKPRPKLGVITQNLRPKKWEWVITLMASVARKTPSKRRVKPYAQGDLDSMCGIYAIVNAFRALCREITCEISTHLFQHLVRCLNRHAKQAHFPIVFGTGTSLSLKDDAKPLQAG